MTASPARIAIIGTGPGGLTCARILQQAGIEVTVYERDPGPDARDQGGTLDMQRETGQAALDRAGLLDTFLAQARPEGQDMLILDQQAGPRRPGRSRGRPRLLAGQVRGLGARAAPPAAGV